MQGLAVVERPGFDRCCHRRVQIGAGHDDERITAAKFQHTLFKAPPRLFPDRAACSFAAGERDGGDARIVQNGGDLRRFHQQGLKDAGRKSGSEKEVFQKESAAGDVFRMFKQADIARHERGGGEADDLPRAGSSRA